MNVVSEALENDRSRYCISILQALDMHLAYEEHTNSIYEKT